MTSTVKKPKKKIIMEAAARLFRDKGYSASSMRDLAKAVNLKASSLYNHIQSKEALLQEICFNNANRFLKGMNEVEKMEASYIEKVQALIKLHIEIAATDITSITAFNDEWRHLKDPHLTRFLNLRKNYEQRFLVLIKKGMEREEIKEMDPQVILFTLFSSVRWLYDWHRKDRKTELASLEKQITELILGGIKA